MRKISKRSIIRIFILAALIVGYLALANYSIYYRIQQGGLVLPDRKQVYKIGSTGEFSTGLVYAALGDSLTSGVGAAKYEESYPYLVAQKLSLRKNIQIDLEAFSYPGARTDDFIENLLGPAIASKPDIVTLLIGTNDVHGNIELGDFRKNYEYIMDRLGSETRATIYAVGLPNIGADELLLPPYNFYFRERTRSYNKIIRSLAEKRGLRFIDLIEPTLAMSKKNDGYYSRDLFHPSTKGYNLWAQIIYDNINR